MGYGADGLGLDDEFAGVVGDRSAVPVAVDAADREAGGAQRRAQFVLAAEAQRAPVFQMFSGRPAIVAGQRHHAVGDLGDLVPGGERTVGRAQLRARILRRPLEPRRSERVAALEHEQAARTQRGPQVVEGRGPFGVGHEHLRHVPGHDREIGLPVRQVGGGALDPLDEVTALPRACDVEHRPRGVDADRLMALTGEPDGEQTGAASEIDDGRARMPGTDAEIERRVRAERVEVVVQRGEAGVGVAGVGCHRIHASGGPAAVRA